MKKRLLSVLGIMACWMSGGNTFAQSPDAGVASIESLSAVCPGSYPVKAVIQNYGNVQIDTVTVNWSVDGVVQSSIKHHSLLDTAGGSPFDPAQGTALVELGSYTFAGSQSYNVKVWTSLPDNEADTVNVNDTALTTLSLKTEPSGLSVSGITTTSADVLFEMLSSTNYVVIYDTLGFDPASGGTNIAGITSPHGLTGLIPDTEYDVYLYTDCGGGIYSDTAGPVSFKTFCPKQSLPYFENFDIDLGCLQLTDGGSTNDTWLSSLSDNIDGTPGAWIMGFPGVVLDETLETPYIDASSLISGEYLLLEYDLNLQSFNLGEDSLSVEVFDGTNWVALVVAQMPGHEMQDITMYAHADLKVRFTYRKDISEAAVCVLDNINITTVSCLQPLSAVLSGITHQSVVVQLNAGVTNFKYEADTAEFTRGAGRITGTAANPGMINGFSPNTTYDIYFQNDCGLNDTSIWVGPYSFKTRCPVSDQMAGNYTIDSSQATGGNNFASFREAADALNDCGIKGPVIFDVAPGTYSESLILEDIAGTSSQNTITFRGTDPATTILTSGSTGSMPTIHLDETDYITFRKITIQNTSAVNARGIVLENLTDHITIDSCKVQVPLSGTNTYGIIALNRSYFASTPSRLIISNSTIRGGERGIYLPISTGDSIINNIFLKQGVTSILIQGGRELIIEGNVIDSLTGSINPSVWVDYVQDFKIHNNHINSQALGISVGGMGLSGEARSSIINNMIIAGSTGILLSQIPQVDVYHNSILSQGSALHIYGEGTGNIKVKNNIMCAMQFYVVFANGALKSSDSIDYNIYYSHSQQYRGFEIGGVGYEDLESWQSADPNRNQHSFESYDPSFLFLDPESDLHARGLMAYGDPSVGVSLDIDGDMRSAVSPYIGADELMTSCPAVVGILYSVNSQTFDDGTGTFTASLSFDENGDAFDLEFGPCGFAQGTGTIINAGTAPVSLTGLTPNGCYDLYVRRNCSDTTTTPVVDVSAWAGPFTFTTNCPDSLRLAGEYTIDPGQPVSETNFKSFTEAVGALSCGVKGPVVFNVASGVYEENIEIGDISGVGPDITIIFRGAGISNTTLSYASPNGTTPVIYLNGADHITFTNMTISATSDPISNKKIYGVVLRGSANYNVIDSCHIKIPRESPTNNAGYGIAVTGNLQGPSAPFNDFGRNTGYADNSSYLTVSNCTITGGRGAMVLLGNNDAHFPNSGHIIHNNVFRDQYVVSMYIDHIQDISISNNDIDSIKVIGAKGPFNFTTIMSLHDTKDYRIVGNRIKTEDGIGIRLYERDINGYITNNMIVAETGIVIGSQANEVDIFHNSVTTCVTAMQASALIYSPSSIEPSFGIDIRNNIFHAPEKGYGFFSTGPISPDEIKLDYNLYQRNSPYGITLTAHASIAGIVYRDLPAMQAAYPDFNKNSIEDNPLFVDPLSDLHIIYSLAHGRADTSVHISTDFDDDLRPSLNPTIGADEFPLPSCVPSGDLSLATPYTDSLLVNWIPGSGSSYNLWYGPLGFMDNPSIPGNKITGITDTFYTITGLMPQMTYDIYVSDYCGGDTSLWYSSLTARTLCTGQLSGIYTIDSSQATAGRNFNSFRDAIQTLKDCGITGPVHFDVQAGVYKESLRLAEIPGASEVNTVTFRGVNVANTVITSSFTEVPVIYFDGTDHVIFRNLTVSYTGATFDAEGVILLENSADYNTIDSCKIEMPHTTTMQIVGVEAGLNFGNNAHHLTVSNCTITGGHWGIYLIGERANYNIGHIVKNNVLSSQSNTGITVYALEDVLITGNEILGTSGANTYGLYIDDIDNYEISKNNIIGTTYGVYLKDGNDGISVTERSRIANNMIISEGNYGMYLDGFEETDIYHNSIIGNPGLQVENQQNMNIRNNILSSVGNMAFTSINGLQSGDIIDYNIYYKADTTSDLFTVGGMSYANLSDWKAADANRNLNSMEINPIFASAVNIHIKSTSPGIDAGDTSVTVYEDIDGHLRPAPGSTGVDIGADEFFVECPLSENVRMDTVECNSAILVWDPGVSVVYSIIEYDTAGFVMGEGKRIFKSSPAVINGLQVGEDYEVYLLDTCGIDTVTIAGPIPFTTPTGPIEAEFVFTTNAATLTDQTVDFDASSAEGALGYVWNFGDGSPTRTGVTISHTYTANGSYEVSLTITGPCGTDVKTDTVVIEGITLEENVLSQSLSIYPNPTNGKIQLSFETQNSDDAVIRLIDLSGKVIRQQRTSGMNGKYREEWDLSDIAKGSYMLQIECGVMKAVEKVILN